MAFIVLIYSILILVGGFIGHAKANSTASLVWGLVFGFLLVIAAGAMLRRRLWGLYMAIVLTLFLDGFFTYRFLSTHNFMPGGVLSLISLVVLILLARKAIPPKKA